MTSTIFGAMIAVVLAAPPQGSQKQHYTDWKLHASGKYYYCEYRFTPKSGEKEKMQYVVWYPTDQDYKYLYYYNPEAKVPGGADGAYWCRAVNEHHEAYSPDQPLWNVLAAGDKRRQLTGISNWPKEGVVPPVPGAVASSKMLAAPPLPALARK